MAYASVKVSANANEYKAVMKSAVAEAKVLASEFVNAQTKAKAFGTQTDVLQAKTTSLSKKIQIQKDIVKITGDQYKELTERLEKQKEKQVQVQEKLDKTRKSYDETEKATGKNSEQTKELGEELKKLETELKKGETAITKMEESLNRQAVAANNAESKLIEMETELKEVNKQLNDKAIDNFSKGCDNISRKSGEISKKVFAISGAVVALSAAAAKMALEFEDSIANINTLLDDDSNLKGYTNAVFDFSNDTGIALDIVSNGMYQTISSIGDGGKETEKMFTVMGKSAKAGNAEVSDSVALISAGMKGYNQINEETAKRISDLGFQTAKLGVTTFPELAKSMQPLFPLANSLAISYEELFGVMATGTGVTGNTAEVTTQFKAILSNLVKPTDALSQAISKYGYTTAQALIETEGLSGFLNILQKETDGQSDAMAKMFSSTEALTLATALCGSQYDTFNEKLSQMEKASGATDKAYAKLETRQDKINKSVNKAKNAMVELGGEILEETTPAIDKISEKVERLTEWFSNLDDDTKKSILKMGMLTAAIAPTTFAFSKLAKGISDTIGVYKSARDLTDKLIKAIAVKTAAIVAETGVTKTAAIAQIALNTAMNMAPWAIITTGIALAVVALKKYSEKIESTETETKKLTEETRILNDEVRESQKEIQANIEAREKGTDSIEEESGSLIILTETLYELNRKTERTRAEQQQMESIIGKLNEAIPEMNLAINEQSGYLNKASEEVKNLIKSQKEYLMTKAAEDDLIRITKDMYKAEKDLKDLEVQKSVLAKKQIEIEREQAKERVKRLEEFGASIKIAANDNTYLDREIAAVNVQMRELETNAGNTRENLATLAQEYENTVTYIGNTKQIEAAQQATITYGGKTIEVSSEVKTSFETISQAYNEAKIKAEESVTKQVGLFDELSVKSELTTAQMVTRMEEQKKVLDEYAQNMQKAAQLVEEGLLDQGALGAIMELGINGAGYLDQLVNASDEDVKAFNENWKGVESAKKSVENTMADIQTNYTKTVQMLFENNNIGANMAAGTIKSINENVSQVKETSKKMGEGAAKGIEERLEINSPSKRTYRAGKNTALGLINAISDSTPSVKLVVYGMIRQLLQEFDLFGVEAYKIIDTKMNEVSSKMKSKLIEMKNATTEKMEETKNVFRTSINELKRMMEFEWSLPNIKVPHFSVEGDFNMQTKSVPTIGVEWYKNGAIMTKPTIFGMNGNKIMAGGEAGAEAILPLAEFYTRLNYLLDRKLKEIKTKTYLNVNVTEKTDLIEKKLETLINTVEKMELSATFKVIPDESKLFKIIRQQDKKHKMATGV